MDLDIIFANNRQAMLEGILNTAPPMPTQKELCFNAVYILLDQTARQYDYRNFAEVAQFVNSNVWKAEADGLLAWQDTVWTKAYELLKAPITSIDDFIEQLPKYVSSSGS
ncbi:MAG: hypothetical protein JHC33_02375 [Ignisphaera sp.]|nr:hypothetical protein [Ignisphaera sp.]